jgi:hypothetical protein
MSEQSPKLFISYSWTSPEHEQWVLALATNLCGSGVDVILDKWHLKEGHDAHVFMEKMVIDPDIKKVALICDRVYAEKADGRSGGVGIETQIISPEIYAKQDQSKFAAIVVEKDGDGRPYLPTYYKSRVYIDLSDADKYATNFEQLLRWIFDKPLHVKPTLGKKPAFLAEDGIPNLNTTPNHARALEAVRQVRPYSGAALSEYFNTLSLNLESFRITKGEGEFDDKVIKNIEEFLPYRNQAIEMFSVLAQQRNTQETWDKLHRFFESLIPYMDKPEQVTSWQQWDFDNFRFIIHELFLYAIASLLKCECFDGVTHMLRQHYYVAHSPSTGQAGLVPFTVFYRPLPSFAHRNERLKLRRLSLRADLLEKRARTYGMPFEHLMQTDLMLFMRDCLECLASKRPQEWWPETLVYAENHYGPFEIFARSQSTEYFNRLKPVLDIQFKEAVGALMNAFSDRTLRAPQWDFRGVNPNVLVCYDKLSTLP